MSKESKRVNEGMILGIMFLSKEKYMGSSEQVEPSILLAGVRLDYVKTVVDELEMRCVPLQCISVIISIFSVERKKCKVR